jgi:hypothetical protein
MSWNVGCASVSFFEILYVRMNVFPETPHSIVRPWYTFRHTSVLNRSKLNSRDAFVGLQFWDLSCSGAPIELKTASTYAVPNEYVALPFTSRLTTPR